MGFAETTTLGAPNPAPVGEGWRCLQWRSWRFSFPGVSYFSVLKSITAASLCTFTSIYFHTSHIDILWYIYNCCFVILSGLLFIQLCNLCFPMHFIVMDHTPLKSLFPYAFHGDGSYSSMHHIFLPHLIVFHVPRVQPRTSPKINKCKCRAMCQFYQQTWESKWERREESQASDESQIPPPPFPSPPFIVKVGM
jgi:hypothetical protein